MTESFDFDRILKADQSGQTISGKEGVLAPLLKQLTEAALEAAPENHVADDVVPNRKNGKSRKTLKTSEGRIDLNTPRDRAGTFEPQIIKKHQTSISDGIETRILSMYGRGLMSYTDISEHVHDLYGISVSTAAISAIFALSFLVWLDAIHYKVKGSRPLPKSRCLYRSWAEY